ncbi:MAG: ribonuclease HII [Gammaproteobacteria bacterium]|nr:MAG: ribonuclease HII [Gammaproteobacteria bacterium]
MIIGVDEAGRGALIGNVVAAAVILPDNYDTGKIADCKSLSEKKREQYADYIRSIAIDYAIGTASPAEIDRLNIHYATLLAMQRAIAGIHSDYTEVWVDGKFTPDCDKPAKAFIKGDALHACISAASILAKTSRDAELRRLDKRYPQYGLAAHKGYPTKAHKAAINRYGILPEHRRSYKTLRDYSKVH